MGGSSYLEVTTFIAWKKAAINSQNSDEQCFKWAIFARHVEGANIYRVGDNYAVHENKYNFTGLNFPVSLHAVNIFENKNPSVSVNMYGLEKFFQSPRKYPTYKVYPLKVVDDEEKEYFDLLLLNYDEK